MVSTISLVILWLRAATIILSASTTDDIKSNGTDEGNDAIYFSATLDDEGFVGGGTAYVSKAEFFDIWRGLRTLSMKLNEVMVVITHCSRSDVLNDLQYQNTLRMLSFCDEDSRSLKYGSSRELTEVVGDHVTADILDSILGRNGATFIIHLGDNDSLRLRTEMLRVDLPCDGFPVLLAKFEGYKPVYTVVADCVEHNATYVMSTLGGNNPSLLEPLVNAIFVTSPEALRSSAQTNMEAIISIPELHNCVMSLEASDPMDATSSLGRVRMDCDGTLFNWNDIYSTNKYRLNVDFPGFGGRTLIAGIMHYPPYVTVDETDVNTAIGYCVEILEIVGQLMDFRVDMRVIPRAEGFGVFDSSLNQWKGGISHVMDAKVDMFVSGTSISVEREDVVDFSYPYFDERLGMVAFFEPEDAFFIIKPLHPYTWLMFLAVTMTAAVVTRLHESASFHIGHVTGSKRFTSWSESLWYSFGVMCNQGGEALPRSSTSRTVVASLWFVVIVIVCSYNSNLTSFLAVTIKTLPYQTLEEALQYGDTEFYVGRTSVGKSYFEESQEDTITQLWSRISSNPDKYLVGSTSTQMRRIFAGLDLPGVVFKDYMGALIKFHENCNWGMMEQTFLPLGFGIAFQQRTPYKPYFDKVMIDLHEAGILVHLRKKHFRFLEEDACDPERLPQSSTLSLKDVWPVFAVAGSGLLVALGMLVLELYSV